MCGRFTLNISVDALANIFGISVPPDFRPRYNIAPSQWILAVRQLGEQREGDLFKWGLVPSWSKDPAIGYKLINARSESIHEKASFRQAIRSRRCLIPSTGFYEWEKHGDVKTPLYFQLKDGSPMAFAGIWESWKSPEGENLISCAILTTSANKLVEPIHDRMPVILHPQEYALWLDRNMTDPNQLQTFYQPYPAETMDVHEVSHDVNSPRNDSPELILPVRH
jgi:putative SOS response-associated peptidase YedK